VSCPLCFGNEYFILYGLVETCESVSHHIGYGWRERGSGAQSVEQLIAFINWGGNVILVEEEPIIALGLDQKGCICSRFLDFFVEVFVRHGVIVRGS